MTRTFLHSFEPATARPITGTTVDLEVSDIEDAGIREVLQTPGAAYGAWSVLDALLAPTGAGTLPFIFKEPPCQACSCAANKITTQSAHIAQALVTNRLRGRFAIEVNKLGVAGLAIELQKAKTTAGVPFFQVQLINKPSESVGKVLSEGEHRCVALAAFLAELSTIDAQSAIVFDDPVSSLDHLHRDLVAARLAEAGESRQVIVFTHDMAFLLLLDEACRATKDRAATPVSYRMISRGADYAGFCHQDPPATL